MRRKSLSLAEYTFQKTSDLFGNEVVMVLRNKDKKHIVSIGSEHRQAMTDDYYNPDDNEHVLAYLEEYNYL